MGRLFSSIQVDPVSLHSSQKSEGRDGAEDEFVLKAIRPVHTVMLYIEL